MVRNELARKTALTQSLGYGGHCYNQTCQAGPWQDQFSAMYTQNLQISIPVTIVVGLLVSDRSSRKAKISQSTS